MKSQPVLLIASANVGKLKEVQFLLADRVRCVLPTDPIFEGVPRPEVLEDGQTYQENSLKKARAYFKAYKVPVLSDDSGLEVDALEGKPGIHSARFGGESISWPERWQHLFLKLKGHKPDTWTARFRCVLCYYDGSRPPEFFEGTTEGRIVSCPQGDNGFGFDPIFFSSILGKTFGEASPQEKGGVSHRSQALKKFVNWYLAQQT